jgi:putative tryptophan/tyrosine transport system substrate-binding protein
MKRREFITAIGGGAMAWPLAARAQQQAMPVIGYLGSASPDAWESRLKAFRQGLSETGFDEGRNVTIQYLWADNHYDRVADMAADLVRREVAVIVVPGSAAAALAVKAATTKIPVVFETGADPVEIGLVPNLNHPGGNVTGISALSFESGPKRLEFLHEALPAVKTFAVLANPTAGSVVARQVSDLQGAASKLGVELLIVNASTDRDLDEIFVGLQGNHTGGLVVIPDVFTLSHPEQIAALASRYKMPAIFTQRAFPTAGGLMSYGGYITETHRLAGIYAGRILKGEKPADLPVMQGTKVELIVNLKTAKALGIDMPPSLLGRADEVIE